MRLGIFIDCRGALAVIFRTAWMSCPSASTILRQSQQLTACCRWGGVQIMTCVGSWTLPKNTQRSKHGWFPCNPIPFSNLRQVLGSAPSGARFCQVSFYRSPFRTYRCPTIVAKSVTALPLALLRSGWFQYAMPWSLGSSMIWKCCLPLQIRIAWDYLTFCQKVVGHGSRKTSHSGSYLCRVSYSVEIA